MRKLLWGIIKEAGSMPAMIHESLKSGRKSKTSYSSDGKKKENLKYQWSLYTGFVPANLPNNGR